MICFMNLNSLGLDDQFVGALTYADDLTLLAPSPAALRRLLFICEQFGAANKSKTKPNVLNFQVVVLLVLVIFFFVASQFFVLIQLCT